MKEKERMKEKKRMEILGWNTSEINKTWLNECCPLFDVKIYNVSVCMFGSQWLYEEEEIAICSRTHTHRRSVNRIKQCLINWNCDGVLDFMNAIHLAKIE